MCLAHGTGFGKNATSNIMLNCHGDGQSFVVANCARTVTTLHCDTESSTSHPELFAQQLTFNSSSSMSYASKCNFCATSMASKRHHANSQMFLRQSLKSSQLSICPRSISEQGLDASPTQVRPAHLPHIHVRSPQTPCRSTPASCSSPIHPRPQSTNTLPQHPGVLLIPCRSTSLVPESDKKN